MNTTTHMLVGAALLGRRGETTRSLAAMLGGLAPDLPIAGLIAFATLIQGASQDTVFNELYYAPVWQSVVAPSHSAFIWFGALAAAAMARSAQFTTFSFAGLLHLSMDLPFHHGDAHRHFWPISSWRYESPISYWDPARYGLIVAPIEAALAIAATAYLLLRHKGSAVSIVSFATLVLYVARSFYFRLTMGHY